MGSSPSHANKVSQTTPKPHIGPTQTTSSMLPIHDQIQIQANQENLEWPLPPKYRRPGFELIKQSPNRYSLDIPPRVQTAAPTKPRKASNSPVFKARETDNRKAKPISDSKNTYSAHVQSQLTVSSHACFNLATSDSITGSMKTIQQSYKGLDDKLKRRLDFISKDADEKLRLIIEDTEADEKCLLEYDKIQQAKQDELYQIWLQKYIVELNKWRSEELADLQEELVQYQGMIIENSQNKIKKLGEEANNLKFNILMEEHQKMTEKTNKLTDELHGISAQDNFQHLGSESKTEINLRIHANVGTMPTGQGCTKDPL